MKTIKQNENNLEYDVKCSSCGELKIKPDNVWFDEKGYGYSTRITKCPNCGKIIILGYIEDNWLDINNDERYYKY